MKYILSILLVLNFSDAFSGECFIKAEVYNYNDQFARLQKPIQGFFNNCSFDNNDTIYIENNSFSATVKCQRAVFATIFFSGFPVNIIIQPGDSIYFKIDFSQKGSDHKYPIQFFGANAEGQSLFYDYNYWPAEKYEVVWSLIKGSKDQIVKGIKAEINKQITMFSGLLQTKQIDKDFYDLISSTITAQLLSETIRKILNENISNIKLSKSSRWSIANELFTLLNTNDDRIFYGLNTFFYRRLYLSFLRIKRFNTASYYNLPDTLVKVWKRRFNIIGDFSPLLLEKNNKHKEVMFGSQIINYLLIEPGYELLKDELEYFKYAFPESEYLKPINSLINRIKQTQIRKPINVKVFDGTAITIWDSKGELTDLYDIGGFLNNGLTYVDVWATWCMPCIKEMQYNFKIDSFLHANKFNRLYISIDAINDSLKWGRVISRMQLGGYHILASERLRKNLVSEFGVGNDILAIPIYYIVKDGKIVLKEAAPPSEFNALKDQIEEIIKNQ